MCGVGGWVWAWGVLRARVVGVAGGWMGVGVVGVKSAWLKFSRLACMHAVLSLFTVREIGKGKKQSRWREEEMKGG